MKRILIATDGSPSAREAVQARLELAVEQGALLGSVSHGRCWSSAAARTSPRPSSPKFPCVPRRVSAPSLALRAAAAGSVVTTC